MEKIYTDPNMENDNTEHIRRKRLSSILKAPRNPLDDLGNGNELTEGITVEKRRRNLRRVSFADTINCRVFERDLKNNTEGGTEHAADAENNVLPHQNEEPGAVSCEITGMNTLLHAPIQAVVQETEAQDEDNTIYRANRQDTTLLFAEDNKMDMTVCHTAVIAQELRSNQTEQPGKIDFTSFLAGCNQNKGKADPSTQFRFFPDLPKLSWPADGQQEDTTTVKKISFSEFFMSFKSNKTLTSAEGPQYTFLSPLRASGNMAQSSVQFVCSREQLHTCDVTRVFRGQDDGMEMTTCQASAVRATFPALCDAPPQQLPCADVTKVLADDGMDLTSSHTAIVSFPFSTVGNKNLNFPKDSLPLVTGNSVFERASNQHLTVQHEQPCTDQKPANIEDRQDPAALQAVIQEARGMSAIPGSVSSETVFRDDKTGLSSRCEDMEITGDYTDVISNDMKSSCPQTSEKPVNTNSWLAENRSLTPGDRDVTRSLTASANPAPGSYKSLELSSSSDGPLEMVTQDHSTAPVNVWLDSCRSSVSAGVSRSRLQPRLSSHLVSLPTEKTVILSEDMDLTKISVVRDDGKDAEVERPAGVFTSVTCKPQLIVDRATSHSLSEQEEMEMTKCHVVVIDDQCNRVTTGEKQMHCEVIPRKNQNSTVSEAVNPLDMDKENVGVISDRNVRRSQAININSKGLGVIRADKLGRTNFQTSDPSSSAKSVCLLQEQKREVPENTVTSTSGFVSLQSQEVASQPLGKNLPKASVSKGTMSGFKPLSCADEKTTIFSADANRDITKSHTVSADHRIILQRRSADNDMPLPSGDQTCIFTYSDDMEMTKLNSVEVDKPQGMFNLAKRTSRKSLKGPEGEETCCFSLDDENNDMDITQSHTAAIGHKILSQNKGGLCSVSSAHAVDTVLFPGSQADMDTTKPCSDDQTTSSVVCDDKPNPAQEASQQARSNGEATVLAVNDMEITKTHDLSVKENALPGGQPLTSTTMFQSFQADMEMTQAHSVGISIRRAFHEERSQLAQQETVSGSKTNISDSSEDMELTRTHTSLPRGSVGVQIRESIPAISAVPADKTLVFAHNQDDMEITKSHTTTVNNNIHVAENQQVSHRSIQQPELNLEVLPCRDKRDFSHKDLDSEYHPNSKDKPNIPPSASSASAFPDEKGAIQVPSGTTPDSVCSASLPEETVAVQTPQDPQPPRDNPVPESSQQDLLPLENLKSKGLSFSLPDNKPVDHSEESGGLISDIAPPTQQPESLLASPDACNTYRDQVLKSDSSEHEDLATDLGLAAVPASNKESQENEELSTEGEAPPKDVYINSEQTKQLPVSDSSRDAVDPILAPKLSGILNVCSKLKNIRRKSTVLSISETAFADQLPKPSVEPEDTLSLEKDVVKQPDNSFCTKEQENTYRESGAAPTDANIDMALKDQYQGVKVSLGIFQPKLPNRRISVSSMQDINAKSSADKREAPPSGICASSGETPGPSKSVRQNFIPSQFIAEEFLPVYLEEMDPNESVSSELMESATSERSKKQIPCSENPFERTEICSKTKRALEDDEQHLQSPKKVKSDENLHEASQDLQVTFGAVSQSQAEVHEGEDPPNLSVKSLDYTHANTSSSLDSVKADTELTIQRSSQMESQLLICEDNLREKFQSGLITVREFLTLLQVHIPIQKPRHSHVPSSCAVSAPPTPEDLLYSQYIHRPRLQVYEEDCQALAQKTEELKLYVDVQDQLLVNFSRSLWEVMRTCSDEELKKFGAELNQMKSYFTRESKILAHNEKTALYSKLLQSVQEQQGKLQSRAEKLDELLKEATKCLAGLGADADWEEWEAECSDEMAGVKRLERELESIEAQEKELQRELTDLEAENERMLVRMSQLKEEKKYYWELLEKSESTEWELTEWNEQRGVFSFLYDSVELTVVFEPPKDGHSFEDPSRKIISLDFESLLNEEAAPPSSCLVHRLIFQFIASQGCWQEKCPTLCHLPQVLRDISSVVSNCRLLGDEIEFLERWGGKFKLLKTDISDTKVLLMFCSSAAFARFELTLSLSTNYPNAPLPFIVRKVIGNIGEEEVSAVLSKVPVGLNYLRRIVSSVHQDLLWHPR